MRVLLETDRQAPPLECRPLVCGGEATIHELPERPGLVAKLYHCPTDAHAAKLAAMLATPPADPMAGNGHVSIAWPVDRLVDADDPAQVLGFAMPRVHGARPVFEFFNPRSRLRLCPGFHYGYLLRTARNLAAAVRAVHERDYVVGDLNETNTLVDNQALVTLVDTDSFQVPDHGRVYRCPVGKPEYTPPELQQVRFADFDRGPEHDAFALAVLVYQLLLQGTHPFAGRFTGDGEPGDLARRIALGQWPHARSRYVPYEPPPLAPPLATLPPPVQDLVRRCFEGGHARSALRPTAAQWQEALAVAEQRLVPCSDNPQHFTHAGMRDCPWCAMARRLGRDPFPDPAAVVPLPEAGGAGRTRQAEPAGPATPAAAGALTAAVSHPGSPAEEPQAARPKTRTLALTYPVPHPAWPGRRTRLADRQLTAAYLGRVGRLSRGWGWLAAVVLSLGILGALGWLVASHGTHESGARHAPPSPAAPSAASPPLP
jgi:DNA-binding helix-hairpin-helix protein with protein kinase domain